MIRFYHILYQRKYTELLSVNEMLEIFKCDFGSAQSTVNICFRWMSVVEATQSPKPKKCQKGQANLTYFYIFNKILLTYSAGVSSAGASVASLLSIGRVFAGIASGSS